MGAALRRYARTYNAPQRAMRELDKAKPSAAPQFPVTLSQQERLAQQREQSRRLLQRREDHADQLNQRLKHVKVNSSVDTQHAPGARHRPLPVDRLSRDTDEVGFVPVGPVPEGRLSMDGFVDLLTRAAETDSDQQQQWSANRLASEFKLTEYDVQQLLAHHSIMRLVVPEEEEPGIAAKVKLFRGGIANSYDPEYIRGTPEHWAAVEEGNKARFQLKTKEVEERGYEVEPLDEAIEKAEPASDFKTGVKHQSMQTALFGNMLSFDKKKAVRQVLEDEDVKRATGQDKAPGTDDDARAQAEGTSSR